MIQLRTHLASRTLPRGLLALAGLLAAAAPQAVDAAPVTFAQFQQKAPNYNDVTFTNNGNASNATLDTNTVGGTAVTFKFSNLTILGPLPPGISGNINAHMVISSSTTAAATSTALPPPPPGRFQVRQGMNGPSNTITFFRDSDSAILLQVTFNVAISGMRGASTASLAGSSSSGDTVNFSSAFLDFSGVNSRAMAVSLSSINPRLQKGTVSGFTKYLRSFTASAGSGSFSADPPPTVPEPSTIALVGLGLVGAPVVLRRRKKVVEA